MTVFLRPLLALALAALLLVIFVRAVRGPYWRVFAPARLRVAGATAAVAAGMALVGGYAVGFFLERSASLDLVSPLRLWYLWVPASIATWLLLVPMLAGASRLRVAVVGVVSVFLGAMLWNVPRLGIGYFQGEVDLIGVLGSILALPLWAVTFGGFTSPVSVPTGVATAFLVKAAISPWVSPGRERDAGAG